MFPIQRELDNHILDKYPELKEEELFDKRTLALQIELGELANELPEVFKYWSHKKNKYDEALEEYVDCLHFILSLGNSLCCNRVEIQPSKSDDIVKTFIELQGIIVVVRNAYHLQATMNAQNYYQRLCSEFMYLGQLIGFSWEQIEKAYMDKNNENYERQANGY